MLVVDGNDESLKPNVKREHHTSALSEICYGSIAGMVSRVFEYPFDTIKVRLQSQSINSCQNIEGPFQCLRSAVLNHGFLSLFRGLSVPLSGSAFENSCLFFTYHEAQSFLAHFLLNVSPEDLTVGAKSLSGAMAGAATSFILTPIELIKCNLQMPLVSTHAGKSTVKPSVSSIIRNILRYHGLLGFWRGQLGSLLRETGGSAAWFGAQQASTAWFHRLNQTNKKTALPTYQQLICGALAGLSYNFLFYPADTIKSYMQTRASYRESGEHVKMENFSSVAKMIWKSYGIHGFYRGCGLTLFRSCPSSAIIFYVHDLLSQKFG